MCRYPIFATLSFTQGVCDTTMSFREHSERRKPSQVTQGDRVVMKIQAHNHERTGSEIVGKVVDAPDEWSRDHIAENGAMSVMADYRVRCEKTGKVWRWATDNGYVHSTEQSHDIGKMYGFYHPRNDD